MLKRLGLSIVSLAFLLSGSNVFAESRRDWIFTQLSSTSVPVVTPRLGFQLGVSTLSYDSRFSTQGSLFWDAKILEVGVRASGRLLGSFGVGRTTLDNGLKDWTETYSVEIARRFVSPEGRFGRLGIQLDDFAPKKERFLHLALDTGILESPTEPGILKLSFHLFRPTQQGSDARIISCLDVGRVLSFQGKGALKAGLAIGWTYHLSKEQQLDQVSSLPDKTLRSEHMIFSANPWLEYATSAFVARASVPLRLFMDKEWQTKDNTGNIGGNTLVTSYPFLFSSPDIFASIVFLL